MKLPLVDKVNFLPPFGHKFTMGPYVYQVIEIKGGKLGFYAKLIDVIIKGVNDGKSPIIDPHTGKNYVKPA